MSDTHPELAALLSGLHRDPADDALWLVASDWLEEAGRAGQAELMRLNLKLRSTGEGEERSRMETRVRALLDTGERPCVPEIANSVGMRLALVPAGTFLMGSPGSEEGRYGDEGPRHEVEISRPFWLGVFLVTQDEWKAVTGDTPSHFCARGSGKARVGKLATGRFPVENVSWEDAAGFCERLSALPAEAKAGRSYRLPTEAEWEMSCRAGIFSHPFHFGPTIGSEHANYEGSGLQRPCPVGSYAPNAWGLYDMHGQAWEWCGDWFGDNYGGGKQRDPGGPGSGDGRVLRGGSWSATPVGCRAAFRGSISPELRNYFYGVRVCCQMG